MAKTKEYVRLQGFRLDVRHRMSRSFSYRDSLRRWDFPNNVGFFGIGANRSVFERSRTFNSGGVLAFRLLTGSAEVFMNPISRGIHFFALSVFIAASGCESVALMPRPDVDQTDSRRPTYGQDQYSPSAKLDRAARSSARWNGSIEVRREISVRTNDQRNVVLKIDPRTVVFDRDREFSVVDLRNGDVVRLEPSRGDYVDVIRLIEASRS
ncbi:MAG: hypothetical protein ABWZ38_06640 [Candidatus Binatia bacterium]